MGLEGIPADASLIVVLADGVVEAPSAIDVANGTITFTTAPNAAHDYQAIYRSI